MQVVLGFLSANDIYKISTFSCFPQPAVFNMSSYLTIRYCSTILHIDADELKLRTLLAEGFRPPVIVKLNSGRKISKAFLCRIIQLEHDYGAQSSILGIFWHLHYISAGHCRSRQNQSQLRTLSLDLSGSSPSPSQ